MRPYGVEREGNASLSGALCAIYNHYVARTTATFEEVAVPADEMARRIAEAGDDPRDFIDIHFSISQAKFNAFKPALRQSFAAARSQKAGQPTFHMDLTSEQ